MLAKLARRKEKGFTLIELMIVIAILGILVSIAVSQFWQYRFRAYHASMESDARSFANAEEAYYVDEDTYCSNPSTLLGAPYGAQLSDLNAISGDSISVDSTSFSFTVVDTTHGLSVFYDSDEGGVQE